VPHPPSPSRLTAALPGIGWLLPSRCHGGGVPYFLAVGLKVVGLEANGQKRPKCTTRFYLFQSICLNQIQTVQISKNCGKFNQFEKNIKPLLTFDFGLIIWNKNVK
jgi:hypothetical protein